MSWKVHKIQQSTSKWLQEIKGCRLETIQMVIYHPQIMAVIKVVNSKEPQIQLS